MVVLMADSTEPTRAAVWVAKKACLKVAVMVCMKDASMGQQKVDVTADGTADVSVKWWVC